MALGTTLSTLRTLLKAEIGNELSVVTAHDEDGGSYMQLFIMGQRDLADQFDWPHLKLRADVSVDAASQYPTLPNTMNFDRPVRAAVYHSSTWYRLRYGIDEAEYNIYDYAESQTSDPSQKWQRYGVTQFELWPVSSVSQTVRFVGQKKITDFSTGASIAELDDLLLVYYVAAQYLTRVKSPLAPVELAKVNARLSQLRRNAPARAGFAIVGGRPFARKHRYIVEGGEEEGVTPETTPFFGSDSQTFGTDETVFGTD